MLNGDLFFHVDKDVLVWNRPLPLLIFSLCQGQRHERNNLATTHLLTVRRFTSSQVVSCVDIVPASEAVALCQHMHRHENPLLFFLFYRLCG